MSALTFDDNTATSHPAAQRSNADALRIAALALLSIRFIQGFIYWGGGSRRFIYAPAKLDPHAASWLANTFQSAMLARTPTLAERGWFRWMSGALPLPVGSGTFQKLALAVFAATVVFNVATYNYYRGSVVTPFHGGPVSPGKHHLSLTEGVVLPNGAVRFHAYLDGGTPAAPSNVMIAMLKSYDGTVLEQWDGTALSHLPASAIANEFAYNRFAPGPFGLRAQMGSMATITLPATSAAGIGGVHGASTLELHTVNGNTFTVAVRPG